MNPEQAPQPQHNFESNPVSGENAEYALSQENVAEGTKEREQNMQRVDRENAPPAPLATNAPAVIPAVPVPVPVPQKPVNNTTGPTIANDDDLIEKEWVDKAKDIIAHTQNDPYQREKAVSQLQVDYLRKRYGKELGTSN